jgi:peptidoglycan/LPS O-acetylase OafA/YrhL
LSRIRGRLRRRPELRIDHAALQGRAVNNFDLLRLVAAMLVMVAHSFELTRPKPERAPVTFMHEAWGELGVIVFFAISGFLVARSWAFDPQPLSFTMKRALRLMPALVISLLLTALVIGSLTTTLPLRAYLEDPRTELYVLGNATFQSDFELPGVFAHTPVEFVVNGSLWTLPLELKAYCLVLGLGLLGLLGLTGRRRLLMPAVAVFLALLTIGSVRSAIPLGDRLVATMYDIQAPPEVVAQARAGVYQEHARLFASFAIGASLFAVGRWIPLRWAVAGVLAALWAVVAAVGGADAVPIATAWMLPYVVLLLAYRTTHLVRLPQRMGDYSYGIYIIAFPVQQAVLQWLAPSSGWVTLAIAAPIVVALAAASWHVIEVPALTLKQRIRRPLERAGAATAAHPLERAALQPDGPPTPPLAGVPTFAQPPPRADVEGGGTAPSQLH